MTRVKRPTVRPGSQLLLTPGALLLIGGVTHPRVFHRFCEGGSRLPLVKTRLVILCLAMWVSRAVAGPLDDARRLVDDLEFGPALKVLDQLEKSEGLDAETLKEVWLLQGISYGTNGKEAKARDAFRKLMVVFPDTQLPSDVPPRVRTPFLEAKDWATGQGLLTATATVGLNAGEINALRITMGEKDVLRLAKFARFKVRADGNAEQITELPLVNGRAEVPPGGKRVEWTVEVLTDKHSVLLTRSRRDGDEPTPVASPVKPTPVTSEPREVVTVTTPSTPVEGGWRRPTGFVLAGAGAVAAGVGVALGVSSTGATKRLSGATRDELGRVTDLSQREFESLEAQANTQATVANVLFATGAVLGAAGVVLIIVGPSEAPVAQLTPAGAGLMLSGSF